MRNRLVAAFCVVATVVWSFGPAALAAASQEKKGTLYGYVGDARSGDLVPKVTVELVGTSISVSTSVDGDYLVEVPAGTYSIRFFKEGFLEQTLENVLVEAGATVEQGAVLTPVGSGYVVDVTANQDPIGLLGDRRDASAISDNISRKEISNDTSSSASGLLQRVTGITVAQDDTVVVRGLGDRYSKTVLNDSLVPTTEPDRQVVPMNLIPANLLQSVKIYKTFTPDQPGEFSGGLVKLETVNLPSSTQLSVSYSIGFNSVTHTGDDNFLDYPGGGRDWLGLGARSRTLPGGIPETERIFRGNPFIPGGFSPEQLETLGESFQNVWTPTPGSARPNHSVSISGGTRFGKFGIVGAFGLKNELQRLDEFRNFYQVAGEGEIIPQNTYDYTSSKVTARLGGVFNTSYEINDSNRIYFKNFLTNQGTDEARFFEGYNDDRATILRNWRLRYIQERIATSQLSGNHYVAALGNSVFTWRFTYSRATLDEPDLRESLYEFSENVDEFIFFNQTQSLFRLYNEMRENIREPAADWQKPWSVGPVAITTKLGYSFINRDRVFDSRRFRFRPRSTFGIDTSLSPEELLSPELIDPNVGFEVAEETRPTDHYDAYHDIHAGYAMADAIWGRWRFIGGVRVEESTQVVNTFDPFRAEDPVQAKLRNTDSLPSIGIAYQLTQEMAIRVGYARTVTRPQFRELSPFEFTDVTGGRSIVGNPDILRTLIQNYDVRWEWFLSNGQLVAVSYFDKLLDDPIETVIEPTAQLRTSFRNADSARNRGLEFEVRKNLGFLWEPLQSLNLGANYTYVNSSVEVGEQALSVLTTTERPLVGQSENVFNLNLVHDLARYDLSTRVFFNYTGERITDVGALGLPDIIENGYPSLDFAISKRFGNERKPWKFEFSLENILNRQRDFRQGGLPFQVYRPGREYSVEISYSFY